MRTFCKSLLVVGRFLLFLLCAGAVALGFEKTQHKVLPDIDQRKAGPASPSQRQGGALRRLQAGKPTVKVDFDAVHGSPQWVRSRAGVSLQPAAGGRAFDPSVPVQAFVGAYSDLFGHGPEVLDAATLRRQATNAHNQVRSLAWEQRLDGIAVYGAVFLGHVKQNGELIAISSTFTPELEQAADKGVRFALEANPPVGVEQAILSAAESIEQPVHRAGLVASNPVAAGAERKQQFSVPNAPGVVDAKLAWFPMSPAAVRLCWQIEITRRIGGERYRVLVDVETGEIQLRRCLTVNATPATYRVFTSDSPSPMSPGASVPGSNQPPIIARDLVTLTSLFTNASPLGWINDGENQTRGNNVDAHLDLNADDLPDLPRPHGSPFRVFDFNIDLNQSPSTYGDAAVTQLFFWCNWMHDQLYQLGFDEAAGNFQKDNFGRGGVEGDPLAADAQDGSGFNNANFTPSDDGISPRVQMYLFNGPTPARDGDLDAEIILHECTHGLSTRLVGAGVGIDALQTQGMGEGWSDFYALSLLSQAQDDPNAVYAMGGYVTYQLSGLAENYYYGIRRYPYCTDLAKNPLTFKDIDPTKAVGHPDVPTNPINPFNRLFVDEVHAQGEVWCVTLWDARAKLIGKYGSAAGNHMILQLVTDGMKLSPANPTFVQARDAILLADEIDNGGANEEELWEAFARRGLGFSAIAPSSSTTVGVAEAFDLPDELGIVPSGRFSPGGPVGGAFTPQCITYALTNRSTNALTWKISSAQPWLSFSGTQGALAAHRATNVTVCVNSNAIALTAGVFRDTLVFSNITTGARQTRVVDFRIFEVAGVPFYDGFETGQLDPHWLSTGTGDFRTGVTATDGPHSGSFHCTFDSFGSGNFARNELTLGLDLLGYTNVTLRFWAKSFGDEPDGPPASPFVQGADFDGVAISADGNLWYEIQELRTVPATNREYVVSLDPALARLGLNYESLFRIRFNHYDNFGIPFDGLAIDDVSITGSPIYRLAVSCPAHVVETNGVMAAAGQVTLAAAASFDVTVQLQSDHPERLGVPASVVVPAGSLSAAFNLTAVNDSLLNGSTPVTVQASAAGFSGGSALVIVDDDETATLRLQIPSKGKEGAGILAGAGSVRLSRRAQADLPVYLFSSDPTAVDVPQFVLVPAGQSSASFDLNLPEDQRLTGPRVVQITAHVENWVEDVADIQVSDNETATLALQLPARVSEGNGVLAKVASVQLSGSVSTNVQVSLVSSTPGVLKTSPSVIVPAGKTVAQFDLEVVDDTVVNGLRSVTITASAVGFASGTGKLDVIDDETAPAPYGPSPPDASTNVPLTTILSWHSSFGELLVNGGFETGDFTGWQIDNSDFGTFIINDGKVDPEGPEPPTPPLDGSFSVVTSQIGSGRHVLSQDVFVPDQARKARLSWADRIQNYGTDFVPFTQEFRVEIRDLTDSLLATVFVTKPGDPLTNGWVRRSFDISQFRGQTIRISFIEQDLTSYFNLHLDDVSVFLESSATPSFDVYFGTNSVFKPTDFRGTVTNSFWLPPELNLSQTYYWQIVERLGTTASTGPVWRFSTRGVGPVHHYEWDLLPTNLNVGQAFTATLIARDDIGNIATGFSGPVQVSALAKPITESSILITEFDTGANDGVEFENVSGRPIDISGWKMTVWDGRSWPAPRVTVTIPSNTICPASSIFQLQRLGTAPGKFPIFFAGVTLFWNNNVVGNSLAILLRDADDNIVDFTCAYDADPGQITNPIAIPHRHWVGESLPASPDATLSFQRIGQTDANSRSGWVNQTNSMATKNPGLTLPFGPGRPIALTPGSVLVSGGTWTGPLILQNVQTNVLLLARDSAGHFGFSAASDVAGQNDLALDLSYDRDQTIPGDTIHYTLKVRNSGPAAFSGILLTNRPAQNLQILSATASQGQCGVLNGMLFCNLDSLDALATISLTIDARAVAIGSVTNVFGVHANETEGYTSNNLALAISTIRLPELAINDVTVTEGNTGTPTATFSVRLFPPSTLPVSVSYATADRTALAGVDYIPVAGTIDFPPGSTNQTVPVRIVTDLLHEISETFEVDLFASQNAAIIDGVGVGRINDDDATPSFRINDVTVLEPAPGETNFAIFNISLSAPSALPSFVSYVTSNGTAVAERDYVPQAKEVRLNPGETNAQIAIPILGDTEAEAMEIFYVNLYSANNALISDPQGVCFIRDNGFSQLDHFLVSRVPSPQYAGAPFLTTIGARDARDQAFAGFSGAVSIRAVLPRADVQIGSGTSVWSMPFGTLYEDARSQVIYLADELGGAANLSAISVFVSRPPGQTLSNWTIRLKHTALSQYFRPAWESSGWTSVYQRNESLYATGWVTFTFSSPFAYDGTNNLLVDLSFNNSSYTADGLVGAHKTGETRSIWAHTDSAFGDPLAWSGTNAPPPVGSDVRPTIRFLREDPAQISPSSTGAFINGQWLGLVSVDSPGTNVTLRVSDGAYHVGASEGFAVESSLDADHDGLADSWQNRYFGSNHGHAGPADDPDGDGVNNQQEFLGDTDPLDPASAVRILSLQVTGGDVRIAFPTVLGKGYVVERASDPGNGSWSPVGLVTVGTNGIVNFVDPNAGRGPVQFYRIRLFR